MTDQTRELVTVDEQQNLAVEVFPGFFLPDSVSLQQRMELAEYVGDTQPLKNKINMTVLVKGVIYHDDIRRDENGNPLLDEDGATIPCVRTIWLCEDGTLLTSTSDVAFRFVQKQLLPILGRGGQRGHLLTTVGVKISPKQTKQGRQTFGFSIVPLPNADFLR